MKSRGWHATASDRRDDRNGSEWNGRGRSGHRAWLTERAISLRLRLTGEADIPTRAAVGAIQGIDHGDGHQEHRQHAANPSHGLQYRRLVSNDEIHAPACREDAGHSR